MPMYFAGLDLGQANDFSSLAITEQVPGKPREPEYHVRHLQRYKLGLSYVDIVADVAGLMRNPPLKGQAALIVDATGVGRPCVDMLHRAGLSLLAVTITGGNVVGRDDIGLTVPKRDLVTATVVVLQAARLKFADGLPDVPVLCQELLNFQVKISDAGHDSYGAWRESAHDDMVLSVALSVWWPQYQAQYHWSRGAAAI